MKIGINVLCNAVIEFVPANGLKSIRGYLWSVNTGLSVPPQSHPTVSRVDAGSLMGSAVVSKEFLLTRVLVSASTFVSALWSDKRDGSGMPRVWAAFSLWLAVPWLGTSSLKGTEWLFVTTLSINFSDYYQRDNFLNIVAWNSIIHEIIARSKGS